MKELFKIDGVREVAEVTGRFDILVTMYSKSLDQMHKMVSEKIGRIEGIQSSESFIEMKSRAKQCHICHQRIVTSMQKQKSESRVAVYYELTKPKIWYLLVFTAFGAALTASNIYDIEISPATWALDVIFSGSRFCSSKHFDKLS